MNQEATDIENRIFEWTFEGQDEGQVPTQEGREKVTGIKDKSLPTEAEAKAQKEEDKAREKQESAPPKKLSKKATDGFQERFEDFKLMYVCGLCV